MAHLPDLSRLMHARKDTLILALWAQVQELLAANATCRQPTDSEQAIRPSTTFRKVTGGFRSNWGGRLPCQHSLRPQHGKVPGHVCFPIHSGRHRRGTIDPNRLSRYLIQDGYRTNKRFRLKAYRHAIWSVLEIQGIGLKLIQPNCVDQATHFLTRGNMRHGQVFSAQNIDDIHHRQTGQKQFAIDYPFAKTSDLPETDSLR